MTEVVQRLLTWRPIGFWKQQPIIGDVGPMPWDYRPFASYVVLPQPAIRLVR